MQARSLSRLDGVKRKGRTLQIENRNGKYRALAWDPFLRRKVTVGTFANKRMATDAAMKMELDIKAGRIVQQPKDIAFGQLCDDFLESSTHINATTYQWYDKVLKPARAYFGEKASTKRISRQEVQLYAASLMKSGLKDTTVCGYVKAVKTVLELAIDWGYREDNPARRLRNLPTNKRSADAIRILTREEHERLVSVAEPAYRVMIAIWPFVGLRKAEMQGLTWAEVDLNARQLRVRYQLREDGVLDPVLKTPKSARTVDLVDRVVRELRAWKLASKPNELDLVFPTPRGLPQTCKPQFYKVWKRICKAAGLEGFRPHSMRHTFATWSLAAGENPVRVADQMGHEKPSITLDTYAHLLPETDPEATRKIEEWYDGQPSDGAEKESCAPSVPQAAEIG